jgi:branched-chain amino acid transport system substrate-binding protein
MRNKHVLAALACLAALAAAAPATAADKLKIGFIATLSGPASYLGQNLLDGFMLGVDELDGRLGGLPTEISKNDDQFKPDVGRQLAERLVKRDQVDIVTGIVFSNVMMALYNTVVDAKTILISANAGPSPIAGKLCSPYFFSTSWQNDMPHAAVGAYVQTQKVDGVFLVASNYAAGQDALRGFKSRYKGRIVGEIYPAVGQLDYAAELAQIAAAEPNAVYAFIAGNQSVNFARQYAESGLMQKIPLYSGFMIYAPTLAQLGDMALGARSAAFWTPDLDNAETRIFVAGFRKKYNYMPSVFAAQAYDAAKLIDAAVREIHGKIEDKEAFLKAIERAGFKSVRGPFKFNRNHFPIENFYATVIARDGGGNLYEKNDGIVIRDFADDYVQDCPMQ